MIRFIHSSLNYLSLLTPNMMYTYDDQYISRLDNLYNIMNNICPYNVNFFNRNPFGVICKVISIVSIRMPGDKVFSLCLGCWRLV